MWHSMKRQRVVPDQVRPKEYVYEPAWWVHVRMRGPCVGKYHASTRMTVNARVAMEVKIG